MSVNRATVAVGEVVKYDLMLRNTGLLTAVSATLTDTLPGELSYVSNSLRCGNGLCNYDAGTVSWNGSIEPGQIVTVTFEATLNAILPNLTPITNTAILDNGHGTRYTLDTAFKALSSDLGASRMQADPTIVQVGKDIKYTVYVYNNSSATTFAELSNTLPSELTYKLDSLECGTGTCLSRSC